MSGDESAPVRAAWRSYAAHMRAHRWSGRLLPLVTERRTDAAVTAVLLGFALPTVPWWWRPPGHGGTLWSILGHLTLALAQSLPFLLRRRHPVPIAAVVAAVLAADATLSLDRSSVTVAAFAAAYGIGAYARTDHPWARRLGTVTLLGCGAVAFETHRPVFGMPLVLVGMGFLIGEAAAQHRRDTAAAVTAAHLAERNHIARDLHDVLAHQLTAIAVQAGSARVALGAGAGARAGVAAGGGPGSGTTTLEAGAWAEAEAEAGAGVAVGGSSGEAIGSGTAVGSRATSVATTTPPRVEPAEVLGVVERLAREALGELGHLLGVLRSEPDDVLARRPAPGLRDLAHLVEAGRAAGLDVALSVEGPARSLPDGADLVAYRIVQESVTNAARHSPGASTLISIAYATDAVAITVANGPVGPTGPTSRPAPNPGSGRGLIGMRERAELHGGSLSAGRTPDGGFRVAARIPVPVPA